MVRGGGPAGAPVVVFRPREWRGAKGGSLNEQLAGLALCTMRDRGTRPREQERETETRMKRAEKRERGRESQSERDRDTGRESEGAVVHGVRVAACDASPRLPRRTVAQLAKEINGYKGGTVSVICAPAVPATWHKQPYEHPYMTRFVIFTRVSAGQNWSLKGFRPAESLVNMTNRVI